MGHQTALMKKKTNYYMGMFIERGERESRTFRVKLERKRAIMSGIKDLFKIVHKVLHWLNIALTLKVPQK